MKGEPRAWKKLYDALGVLGTYVSISYIMAVFLVVGQHPGVGARACAARGARGKVSTGRDDVLDLRHLECTKELQTSRSCRIT